MRTTRTAIFSAVAALALLSAAGARAGDADNADLAGTWNLTIDSPQGKRTPTLLLVQSGSVVTGTYRSQMGESPLTGTVKGNDFALDVKVSRQGQEMTLAYRGTVSGSLMKGTLSMGRMGELAFAGARAAALAGSPVNQSQALQAH